MSIYDGLYLRGLTQGGVMNNTLWQRRWFVFFFAAMFLATGCDDDPDGGGDADGDADADADSDADGDGGSDADSDADEDGPPDHHPRDPVVTECPGPLPPAPDDGVCSYESGTGDGLLISGVVLTPGEVLRGGEVLIDGTGNITCVGCDCAAADDVSRIDCLHGVISPGLINPHDHITYTNNVPYTATDERYEHRNQWRRGWSGHTELDYNSDADRQEILWGELRMVMGGATSLNGSGSTSGFLRNLDKNEQEGLGRSPVDYSSYPLGDWDATILANSCNYPDIETAASIADVSAYTPHIAEGIILEARNEFFCVREGSTDLVQEQSAFMHGIGLTPLDIAEMSLDGTDLIWSPRTNISLYGDTARVTEYHALGVRIALGTDWIITGSMNMLRELQCADLLNDYYLRRDDGLPYFTSEELWLMATRDAARVLGVGDVLGTLAPGRAADIAIFDGSTNSDHRAVIDAEPQEVVLVLRRGDEANPARVLPLFGDDDLVAAMQGGEDCDVLDVCGVDKAVCVARETNDEEDLASLEAANSSFYPLFFCGSPEGEPSCVPWRDAEAPFTDPEVNGSNRYTGESSADDEDGDGIPNVDDNCPRIFNPIRPIDDNLQADIDFDGLGDACDPCPLHPDTTTCDLPERNDLDADGVVDSGDNCPRDQNPGQEDADADGHGDICDLCPEYSNPGDAPCAATIYDIKDPTGPISMGQSVTVAGSIVTAVGSSGFFMQVDPEDSSYVGPEYSGIFVYTSSEPAVTVGDRVDITTAEVTEYNCQLELGWVELSVIDSGVALPDPVEASTAEIRTGGPSADVFEGVLVQVSNLSVTDDAPERCRPDDGENELEVSDAGAAEAVRIDDFFYAISPLPGEGENLASITGVLATRDCCSKLLPRDVNDVVFGSAGLASLDPPLSYAWEGMTGSTFPEPLTVSLTRIASDDITVTVTSSDAGLVVDDVTIPAGSLSAEIPVDAVMASTTPYTINVSLDGDVLPADVRVVGPGETPTLTQLLPEMAVISVGASFEMTVVLDLPAPTDGTVVSLSLTGDGTLPAEVTVAEEQLWTTFIYTAGDSATVVDITATLGGDELTSTVEVVEGLPPGLVINELDYDSVGTDSAEFLEIYNASPSPAILDGLAVIAINGATDEEYDRWDLSGVLGGEEFLLLAGDDVVTPLGVTVISLSDNSIQNGDPDGIVLFDTVNEEIVDALSYEGSMTAVSISGVAGAFDLVEGTATDAEDNNTSTFSLIRSPDGADTDDAADDWFETSTPTPGEPNILTSP